MLITIINTSNPRNTDKNSTETQMQIYWQRIRQNSQNNTKPYNNHFLSLPNLGNVHMYMGSFYNWYLSKAWQSNRWHYNPNCTEILGNQKPKTFDIVPCTYVNTVEEWSGISENSHCGRSFSKVFSDLICCSLVIT